MSMTKQQAAECVAHLFQLFPAASKGGQRAFSASEIKLAVRQFTGKHQRDLRQAMEDHRAKSRFDRPSLPDIMAEYKNIRTSDIERRNQDRRKDRQMLAEAEADDVRAIAHLDRMRPADRSLAAHTVRSRYRWVDDGTETAPEDHHQWSRNLRLMVFAFLTAPIAERGIFEEATQ